MLFFKQLRGLVDTFVKRSIINMLFAISLCFGLPDSQTKAIADEIIEYQVKAAFIYNFIAFTQWPEDVNQNINLCLHGEDYFGGEIDKLQSKSVNNHKINVARINDYQKLDSCQAIFFSKSVINNLPSILNELENKPILTLADSPKATSLGVTINMGVANEKIVFEINLAVARKSGLSISSKLLQLAHKGTVSK